MTLLRLAGPRTFAALMLMITGGSAVTLKAAPSYTPATPQTATQGVAQYPQYSQYPQANVTVPPVQPQVSPYAVTTQPAQQPMMQQTVQQAMPQAPVQNYRVAQNTAPGGYQMPNYQMPQYQAPVNQAPQYQAPAPGQRFAMNDPTPAAPAPEAVPAPPGAPAPNVAPAQYPENYSNQPQAAGYSSYPATQQGGWEGYVQAPGQAPGQGYQGAGCETGNCGTEECDPGMTDYLKGHLTGAACGRQWFFGAYALFMTRDNPSYHKFASQLDMPSYPYYPSQSEVVLSTDDIEPDWQWGAEVRLGSTFGRSCDPCGAGARPYAWELVYWGLAEDEQSAMVSLPGMPPTDYYDPRLVGMINYVGLNYDRDGAGGGAARPMNDYVDYEMPVTDNSGTPGDVVVLGVRVRSKFTAQNLELNFIRFPVAGCGYDPCCPPRFTVNGLAGVRFLRLDDDLEYAVSDTVMDGSGTPNPGEPTEYEGFPSDENTTIFHDINVDNQLVGLQLGANMNWLIGCKWSAFCDTQFGIYGNNIDSYQRVYGGGDGMVSWANGSTNPVVVNSDKTDVSFMTEVRAGMGYQVGCNCRITAAYRLMALTGVALSGEQIPTDWSSRDYVAIIDSNDSLILHGLQTGVEWKY
ncbi:BBP7 family outer membrane beta-barrel protein [Aeoliella sp. SH292]|uniref:BBP7 family outer membrane beta-barrel protein n=1 Tax=Aeoliella sp. SH292 TaxID=3454464 RepID=UPI003F9AE6C4